MTTNDLDYDLTITEITRRAPGGGAWVSGRIDGYRFDALVFPGHAEYPGFELGRSRISKLWIQRRSDRATVYNWDRGADVEARDAEVQAVVDFLAEGLANLVHSKKTSG